MIVLMISTTSAIAPDFSGGADAFMVSLMDSPSGASAVANGPLLRVG